MSAHSRPNAEPGPSPQLQRRPLSVRKETKQIEIGLDACLSAHALLRPGRATVLRHQHERPQPHRNAMLCIEEMHRKEGAVLLGTQPLNSPGFAAIGSRKDRPQWPTAHPVLGPTKLTLVKTELTGTCSA